MAGRGGKVARNPGPDTVVAPVEESAVPEVGRIFELYEAFRRVSPQRGRP